MNDRIRFLFFLLLGLPFLGYGQDEDEIPEIITNWEDAPLYLSAGPTLSQYRNSQSTLNFPFKLKGEAGFLFQYSLNQQFPFWSGLEFQMRGYSIRNFKSGKLPDGRNYEDKVNGDGKMNYLVFPMLFSIPSEKPEKKLHFLAGASLALRVYSRIKFKAVRVIPSDTLEIPVEYDDVGNDAIDLMDFNLMGGLSYRIRPGMEILATGSYKVIGFSIGQENFFSQREKNLLFSLKLVYRIGRMTDLPFF
jgi:hypothetical protein